VEYDGLEMSAQDFFSKLKKNQQEIIYTQLQGFALIDANKRWRKSINIIKKSKDKKSAKQNLIEKLGLSDYQAEVYLDCGIGEIAIISHMNIAKNLFDYIQR
jgi:DNA gyrase/topoisomerase IV subunit A